MRDDRSGSQNALRVLILDALPGEVSIPEGIIAHNDRASLIKAYVLPHQRGENVPSYVMHALIDAGIDPEELDREAEDLLRML